MTSYLDYLGDPVVKNAPAGTGDMDLIPGPRAYMLPWGS